MENIENQNTPFETDQPPVEPAQEQPVQPAQPEIREPASYRGAGTGRRESPYANSPYVMNREQENRHQTQYRYEPQYEKPVKVKKKRNFSGLGKKLLAVLAVLGLVIGSCAVTANMVNSYWEQRLDALESDFEGKLGALEKAVYELSPANTGNSVSGTTATDGGYTAGQVYAANVQSVVLIESTVVTTMYGQTASGTSTGSGFVLTEDGYVITNYHVVEGATSVTVRMYDNTAYAATLVGYDNTNDVAVLKVEATGLNAVTVGSSTNLIVGDQVVAIGNPLGELTSTLTVGYVSAKERDVSTDGTVINMLQTDCAINSGNSGGPLFNMKGEVVGITTAKYSGSSSSGASIEGIGFAIPMDDVIDVIGQLVETGTIQSGYMGVIVQNMDEETASIYGLPIGAYVVSVEPDGGAYAAGIQAKDIITKVGDVTIENITDLTRALRGYKAGDVAQITIYRGGLERTLDVTLAERPADADTRVEEYQNPQGSQETQGDSQPQDPNMPEGDYWEWYDFFAPFFGFGD